MRVDTHQNGADPCSSTWPYHPAADRPTETIEADRHSWEGLVEVGNRVGVEVEDLPRSLNEYIAQVMKGKDGPPPDWIEKVAQVRIAITEDRLAPTRTRLFVIPDTPLDGDETKLWRDWHNRGKKLLSTAGIKLDATASKASTQWRRAPT